MTFLGRKGITPIIAIVLLLMITVAVAGSVNFFLSRVQTSAQTDIEDSTVQITASTQQRLEVIFKTCNASGDVITARISNVGTKRIAGGEITLTLKDNNGNDLAIATNADALDSINFVEPDSSFTIDWNVSADFGYDLLTDQTYKFEVRMPNGITTSSTCTT